MVPTYVHSTPTSHLTSPDLYRNYNTCNIVINTTLFFLSAYRSVKGNVLDRPIATPLLCYRARYETFHNIKGKAQRQRKAFLRWIERRASLFPPE